MPEKVLIAGPAAARDFLSRLADQVSRDGVDVIVASDLLRPSEHPHWENVDILVAYAVPCSAADMDRARALRAIITPSLGYEGIDINAATKRGIIVANGQVLENYQSVAEAVMLLVLMALYDVNGSQRKLRPDKFPGAPRLVPRTLSGKTIGVIGYGNIGRELIKRLQGWNVTILVHTRTPPADLACGCQCVSFDQLIAESDIVIPLVPLTDSTRHMLDRDRLLSMRDGAILVNMSRGGVIEEKALSSPEVSTHLRTIALDVFETEPLPVDSPLRTLGNTVLTPHELARTQENLEALFVRAVKNINAVIENRLPETALNLDAWAGRV
tara:strand:- start:205 stop:1185 length:981 start_codon:yes stop_codon:yes gene_type:complete